MGSGEGLGCSNLQHTSKFLLIINLFIIQHLTNCKLSSLFSNPPLPLHPKSPSKSFLTKLVKAVKSNQENENAKSFEIATHTTLAFKGPFIHTWKQQAQTFAHGIISSETNFAHVNPCCTVH